MYNMISRPRGQPLWTLLTKLLRRYHMDTPVEFDSKNRPTHDYLSKTSMNVVTEMYRSIPEHLMTEGE